MMKDELDKKSYKVPWPVFVFLIALGVFILLLTNIIVLWPIIKKQPTLKELPQVKQSAETVETEGPKTVQPAPNFGGDIGVKE